MGLSNCIALGSAIIAGVAIFRTWVLDKKIKTQEYKLLEFQLIDLTEKKDEKKKALMEAKVFRSGDWWTINIYNRGIATARNIRFIPTEANEDAGIILNMDDRQLPYPLLHNGGSFDVPMVLAEGHNPIALVKLIWDDDYANNNEREIVLNF